MKPALIVADLGTGSMRVGAVTEKAKLIASARVPLGVLEPFPGWAEIDPEEWWNALRQTTAEVLDELPDGFFPAAVCLSGVTRSQVLLDSAGRVLRPAMLFRDRRAEREARAVASHYPAANPAEAISAFHPLARMAWLMKHEGAIFEQVAALLEPKDFLNWRLTGETAADAITYSRFDAFPDRTDDLPDWLARIVGLLAGRRLMPWQQLGPVAATAPPFDRIKGVPVFVGSMDTWATAVGAGAIGAGQGYDVAGTSEAVGLITSSRAKVAGLVSIRWGADTYQLGGPTQIGADAGRWAHDAFRIKGRLASAIERAGALIPGEDLPLFLPYLAGERAPVWRSDLRGAFFGLNRMLEGDGLLWSTMEGVAHSVRDILDTAQSSTGERLSEIRICGGGAQSDAWCQLKSDVVGVPVVRTVPKETGLIGAAMCAATGLGIHASLVEAAREMSRIDAVFEPREPLRAFFERRARIYQRMKRFALELADQPPLTMVETPPNIAMRRGSVT